MGLIDKVRDMFDYTPEDSKRAKENKQHLDALAFDDDIDQFIKSAAIDKHETNRLVHVLFRQVRSRNAEIRKNIEIFLDRWAFHHGGLTKENFRECVRDLLKYGKSVLQRANANQEEAEYRAMCGPLGEFDGGGPMGELPSDDDFAKAIRRRDAELERNKP